MNAIFILGLSKEILDQVVFILKKSVDPNKDPQLRSKYLLLIPEVFSINVSQSANELFQSCFEEIINNMIVPNIVWKAGRAAAAVRTSAIASLLMIIQSDAIKTVEV